MPGDGRRDLKAELEALKARARGVFRTDPPSIPGPPVLRTPRAVPRVPEIPEVPLEPLEPRPLRPSGPLDRLVPGILHETMAGSLWRVVSAADALRPEAGRVHGEYLEALSGEAPAAG
ncbi:MAG: hypothetical protein PHQ19_03375, partial [Candidatus Krumholzibacteria bacterium]|nr:hypothetical protein [Candidatus Krumholzibacteria bacterium]